MLTGDRYIARQIIIATLFAVAILSGVFVLGNIFKSARPLFVGQNPSPWLVIQFIISVLPFSLMFTIPWSFLAAVLLVFGRLSADNEITALRMAGRSLPRIAIPVFLVAITLSGIGFALNAEVAPRAKAQIKQLLFDAVKEDPNRFLDPGVVQTHLDDYRIYVEARDGNDLTGVHIQSVISGDTQDQSSSYIYAEHAKLKIDSEDAKIKLHLINALVESKNKDGVSTPIEVGEIDSISFDFKLKDKRRIKASTMTSNEIRAYLATSPDISKKKLRDFRNEITRRQSFSFSCLAFAAVGIPLGLGSRRRETSTGFAVSLAVGFGYFLFFIIADKTKTDSQTLSTILFWLPNILSRILGIWLFRRARSK